MAGRLKYKYRRHTPSGVLQHRFEAAVRELGTAFLKSAAFNHALSKGEEREVPVREFFRANLPRAFGVEKGEAVDITGNHSTQLDLIILDQMRNSAFYNGPIVIIPAEALLVSIEVKSLLTTAEVKSILLAAAQLRRLKPFKEQLAPVRRGGIPADRKARFFHCVFAYDSDLSREGWLGSEIARFHRISSELNIPCSVLDRVYVANRGMMNVAAATGVEENHNEGTALLQFYMHVLNFLARENARREPVPYVEYAGKMGGGWKSFRGLLTSSKPAV